MKKRIRTLLCLTLSACLLLGLGAMGALADEEAGLPLLIAPAPRAAFSDLNGSPYGEAILALAQAGIFKGVGDNRFAPESTVTRAMAITVLGRMAGVEEALTEAFTDVDNASWYAGYVGWAAENGIVQGDGQGHFMPNSPVTGEHLELMLSRYCEKNDIPYVATNPLPGAVTRGLLAQMVYNVFTAAQAENGLTATQTLVLEGCDWGPAVAKTVLKLDKAVDHTSLTPASFAVTELKESFNWMTFTPGLSTTARTVTEAYASDAEGNPVDGPSDYLTLSLAFDPDTGSPYYYDFIGTGQNRYASPYNLLVTLTAASTLTTQDGQAVDSLTTAAADVTAALMPQLKDVTLDGTFTGADGRTLTYAAYAPKADAEKHPLVIWLHGMGEGGTDPTVALLGNKLSPLFEKEFQDTLGGAYVLVPQTAQFWLAWNEEDPSSWGANPGTRSLYTATLMELIEDYVAKNPAIDPDRILIGGCSNGGYMTMNMVIEYPGYFAAAFPICEAYMDSGITAEKLATLKDLPIWFVYAEDDTTVNPETYEAPTIARLRAISPLVRTSIFDHVVDTSGLYKDAAGNPYQYMGHWSWLYFFNNQCQDDMTGENLWQWLAAQSK